MSAKALVATLAACGALAFAAPASATVTIGPNLEGLAPAADPPLICQQYCTYANLGVGAAPAPGGFVSPVTGTITAFRIKIGAERGGGVVFQVIRPVTSSITGPNARFETGGPSAAYYPAANSITTYPILNQPIRAGDLIGVTYYSYDPVSVLAQNPGALLASGTPTQDSPSPEWLRRGPPRFPAAP